MLPADLPTRGIVGVVDVTGVVRQSDSPWFDGPYGWTLANPREVPFVPMRGSQGFFETGLTL